MTDETPTIHSGGQISDERKEEIEKTFEKVEEESMFMGHIISEEESITPYRKDDEYTKKDVSTTFDVNTSVING